MGRLQAFNKPLLGESVLALVYVAGTRNRQACCRRGPLATAAGYKAVPAAAASLMDS